MMETLETWKLPCYNHAFKETIWKLDGNLGNLNKKNGDNYCLFIRISPHSLYSKHI